MAHRNWSKKCDKNLFADMLFIDIIALGRMALSEKIGNKDGTPHRQIRAQPGGLHGQIKVVRLRANMG